MEEKIKDDDKEVYDKKFEDYCEKWGTPEPKPRKKKSRRRMASESDSESEDDNPNKPNPPKKPMNAFFKFVSEVEPAMKEDFPDMKRKERLKKLGK